MLWIFTEEIMSYKRCQNNKAIIYVIRYYLNTYFVSFLFNVTYFVSRNVLYIWVILSNSFFDRLVFHSSYLLFTQYNGLSNTNDRFINIISFMNSVLHLITKRSRRKSTTKRYSNTKMLLIDERSLVFIWGTTFLCYTSSSVWC